jgi:uncharacterized protein (DUF697 family)
MTTKTTLPKDHALVPFNEVDVERVRERCRKLVRNKALRAAGMSALPIPGVDLVSDLTMFANVVEEVNLAFGLTPAQIERLQPRFKIIAYQAIGSIGGMLVGKLVTRELVMQVVKRSGAKIAAKSATKFVPIAGSVAAAAIGFVLFRQMGYQHIEACAKVARQVNGTIPEAKPAG